MSVMKIPGHVNQKPGEVMLEEIENLLGDCKRCELGQTRSHLVFGTGDPHARVMFVGEGPGKNEDLKGEPFVGAAGKKLDSLLSIAGLTREEIYIANVVKCRPPGNRNPKPDEIEACSPFLREQIRSVWPDVIVCLGNFASQWVLKTDRGVTQLRGKLYQQGHFVVAPTFHPAACIYHSDWQPLLEEDLARVGAWLAANPRGEVTAAAATAHKVRPVADAAGKKAPAGAGLPEEAAR
ncbi:uracil-DNA glycosylase [uncultured Parolsenella sp.]|uniref:uracil-DNA glycosylase n=1 Tax=uncultured Parolsenella sp. TaxID=2083008 RepID=UPI0025FDDA9C|nr:uracil-DNA glycosylase [uncultured Parolsenella sp.]